MCAALYTVCMPVYLLCVLSVQKEHLADQWEKITRVEDKEECRSSAEEDVRAVSGQLWHSSISTQEPTNQQETATRGKNNVTQESEDSGEKTVRVECRARQ